MQVRALVEKASALVLVALPLVVLAQNGPPGQTGAPASSVTVVNGANQPVPVTGNVGVTGSVSINNASTNPVPITGSVALSGTPSVSVNNLQNLAVERGRFPYQQFGFANTCPNASYCYKDFPPAPAGMRLVVTHISGSVSLQGPTAAAGVSVAISPPFNALEIPTQQISATRFTGSSPVTFYFESGQTPYVVVSGADINQDNSRPVAIVGYLVPTQ